MSGKGFWGPPIWSLIHELSLSMNGSNSFFYKKFLGLLTRLLPCTKCKNNLNSKLISYPPDKYLTGPLQAFLYSYILHDLANKQISSEGGIQKISPPFEFVRDTYLNNMRAGPDFWGPSMWATFYILAAVLTPENSIYFKEFIETVIELVPDELSKKILKKFLREYSIDPYLRNNHDAFFYIFTLHNNSGVGQIKENLNHSYIAIKSFYFSKLGEECKGCKV